MAEVLDYMDEWGPEKIVVVYDTRTKMKCMLLSNPQSEGM